MNLDKIEDEHVSYEYNMMQICNSNLHSPMTLKDKLLVNILHAAFCVYANNCLNYLIENGIKLPPEIKKFQERFKIEIFTLTKYRNVQIKIVNSDRNLICKYIIREWTNANLPTTP